MITAMRGMLLLLNLPFMLLLPSMSQVTLPLLSGLFITKLLKLQLMRLLLLLLLLNLCVMQMLQLVLNLLL